VRFFFNAVSDYCRILTNLLKELCIFASKIEHTIIYTLQAVEDTLNDGHNKVVQKLKDEIEHLRKQLAWYKTFFDHTSDAVFIVQPDTWSVLDANEQAAIMVGINHHELVGESLPQFRRVFNALSKSSTPSVLSELTFSAPEGESRMVEVNAGFIEFGGQKVIIASARDVTEQRELSEKMVQADKLALLGKLTAGVAHEIRNPLAAINMNLQVLQRKISVHAPEMFNVQTALQGVERLGNIVEATLNFSRPSIAAMMPENINVLVRSSLKMVQTNLNRKIIDIQLHLDDTIPLVEVDSKQMQQVFINLFANASDAIKAKGSIEISTFVEKGNKTGESNFAVVAIKDSGIGITKEDMNQIFNPFFTRKPDGTGLGLPITQQIIHQHGGNINVESEVGIGTCFSVKLPLRVS